MKDFTGREIKLGDKIAFYSVQHKKMFTGRVYNIGKKMVCSDYIPYAGSVVDKQYSYPEQCIILESENEDLSMTIRTI